MNSILPTLTVRLVRPGAVLLALTAIFCLWQGAASFEYAADLDIGTTFFWVAVAGLYGVASSLTWNKYRFGAWLAALLIGLWTIIGLRWGRLPPVEVLVSLLIGPALALAAWQHLGQKSTQVSRGHLIWLVGTALIALALVSPLWHCHEGYGGIVDYHCHSVFVHGHVH